MKKNNTKEVFKIWMYIEKVTGEGDDETYENMDEEVLPMPLKTVESLEEAREFMENINKVFNVSKPVASEPVELSVEEFDSACGKIPVTICELNSGWYGVCDESGKFIEKGFVSAESAALYCEEFDFEVVEVILMSKS